MYAITEGVAKINDRKVHAFKREVFAGDAVLTVKAGTTGYKGEVCRKDSSRTFVCLESILGDVHFTPITDPEGHMTGFQIVGCGDDTLNALVRAVKFVEKVLDEQRLGYND
jgi:hypothetical protein